MVKRSAAFSTSGNLKILEPKQVQEQDAGGTDEHPRRDHQRLFIDDQFWLEGERVKNERQPRCCVERKLEIIFNDKLVNANTNKNKSEKILPGERSHEEYNY